ncbi:hypothetical protein F5884DRAFT_807894 [Xylogone sp. PMI_703]|nr:hypothetical protein F5884DRAFT_807894 [Xylogone sp. PMI_703]
MQQSSFLRSLQSPKPTQAAGKLPRYNGETHLLDMGQAISALGLGTFQDPDEQENSVHAAMKSGNRHIDTAHNYGLHWITEIDTSAAGPKATSKRPDMV